MKRKDILTIDKAKLHLCEYINAILGQMEVSHCPICHFKNANVDAELHLN